MKDARFSPQRKAIFDASWSPLQVYVLSNQPFSVIYGHQSKVVDEHDLSTNGMPTHASQAFTFPTVRPKASSSSDVRLRFLMLFINDISKTNISKALVKTDVLVHTRKEKRSIAQRKKFTSEYFESESNFLLDFFKYLLLIYSKIQT